MSREDDERNKKLAFLYSLNSFLVTTEEYQTLGGKTQVFDNAAKKPELELTTRIMHIRSVAELARDIAIGAGLDYEEQIIAEIIGHAHDIGHTPFGHNGENILNNEIKKFGPEYIFKHQKYGANVFEEIYNRFLETYKKSEAGIDEEYTNKLREIIRNGIINHNQYYAYKVKNESMPQKCVRIADFIAFMISDVSDLLRYKNSKGKSIITEQEIIKKIDSEIIDKIGEETIANTLQTLKEGGPKLTQLRSNIVKEIIESASARGDIMTMTDKYKILKDMQDACEFSNREGILNTIISYYNYSAQNKENVIMDEKYMNEILEQTNKETELENREFVDKIVKVAEKIYKNQIREVLNSEIKNAPLLTTLFTIQQQQYLDIVLHDTILENEQNEEKIVAQFNEILKLAYYAKSKENGKTSRLKEYKGKVIPRLSEKRYEPLEYAVFVIQQMMNEDFERKDFISEILSELGITEEEIESVNEIAINDIYEDAKSQKIENKKIYLPGDIKSLTVGDISINSNTVSAQKKSESKTIERN